MADAAESIFTVLAQTPVLLAQSGSVLHTIFSRPEICVMVCGAAVAITGIIVWGIVASRQSTLDANLKQAMIDRRLPAEEIERILYASSDKEPPKNPTRSTPSKSHMPAKELA
jgi:hypothetical protein